MNSGQKFYPQIESLRGVAALVVVLCHVFGPEFPNEHTLDHLSFSAWSNLVLQSVFGGIGAIMLFFVISGYALNLNLRPTDQLTVRAYLAFAIRRVFRIMPAAWASLAFASAISAWYFHSPADWTNWINILLIGDKAPTVNGPLWTLNIELICSALFPLLAFANRRLGPAFQTVGLIILMWMANTRGFFPWFTVFLFCFQLGIMIDSVGVPIIARLDSRLAGLLLAIAIVAVVAAANVSRLGFLTMMQHIFIEGIASFYIVAYVIDRTDSSMNALLLKPAVRFLGRISYSLYVFHAFIVWPVYDLVGRWLGPSDFVLHFPIGESADVSNYSAMLHLLAGIISVPLSVIVAYAAWRYIELPFHDLGRKIGFAIAQRSERCMGKEGVV